MSTSKSKSHCEVCAADLLQVGERKVSCPGDDLDLSLCPGCAVEVLAQLAARGILLRCAVCETDLLQVGEWRVMSCPEENWEFVLCPGCAEGILAQLAARRITLEASGLEVGVYQFKQEDSHD